MILNTCIRISISLSSLYYICLSQNLLNNLSAHAKPEAQIHYKYIKHTLILGISSWVVEANCLFEETLLHLQWLSLPAEARQLPPPHPTPPVVLPTQDKFRSSCKWFVELFEEWGVSEKLAHPTQDHILNRALNFSMVLNFPVIYFQISAAFASELGVPRYIGWLHPKHAKHNSCKWTYPAFTK